MADKIKGGKGDKLKPTDVDAKELKIGMAVEREHTDSDEVAQEIALDHLEENPHYYSDLVKKGIVDEPEALKIAKGFDIEPVGKLKEIIRKRIWNRLQESRLQEGEYVDDKIAKILIKKGVNYDTTPEKEVIKMIPDVMRKLGYTDKQVRYYMSYDEDWIGDIFLALKHHSKKIKEDVINEGVEDPNILKAVFLAGGPGSGKSFIANDVMGVSPITPSTSAFGLKVINSDPLFEMFLKKLGIKPSELTKLSKADFKKATEGPDSARGKAKALLQKQYDLFLQGRIGVILDGTAKDINKVKREKAEVEKSGYDSFMIFTNTSLKSSLERNRLRPRKLPDDLVEQMWNQTQKNKNNLKELFGSNFYEVNNDKTVDVSKKGNLFPEANKAIGSFLKKPIKNPVGKKWVEAQHKIKNMLNK